MVIVVIVVVVVEVVVAEVELQVLVLLVVVILVVAVVAQNISDRTALFVMVNSKQTCFCSLARRWAASAACWHPDSRAGLWGPSAAEPVDESKQEKADITWAGSTSGWCHPPPYLISHSGEEVEKEGGTTVKVPDIHQDLIRALTSTDGRWPKPVKPPFLSCAVDIILHSTFGVKIMWLKNKHPVHMHLVCANTHTHTSHHSISSQSSSVASNEAVLFILMIAALQQAAGERNKEENLLQNTVSIWSEKRRRRWFGLSKRSGTS